MEKIDLNILDNDYIKNNIQYLVNNKNKRIAQEKKVAFDKAMYSIYEFFSEKPDISEKCIILVDSNYIHHVKDGLIDKGFDVNYNSSTAKPINGDYQNLLQTSLIITIK